MWYHSVHLRTSILFFLPSDINGYLFMSTHHHFSWLLTFPSHVLSFNQTLNDDICVRESSRHVYLQTIQVTERTHSPKCSYCHVKLLLRLTFGQFPLKPSSGCVCKPTPPKAGRSASPPSQSLAAALPFPSSLLGCVCIHLFFLPEMKLGTTPLREK